MWFRKSWVVILILSTFVLFFGHWVNAQEDCEVQESCTSCIRTRNCAWCDGKLNETEATPRPRCVNPQEFNPKEIEQWCSGNVLNPTSSVNAIENESLSSSTKEKQIRIQPQIVNLKLRQGEEHRFILRYNQAKDYPVDLYFVADLSWSMRPFWKELGKLESQIVKAMKKLTSDFQLGFGSFIDKNIRPMVADKPEWDSLRHYAFRHHMKLTNDTSKFEGLIKNSKDVGNSDDPEGGLDGVMQAIVCKDEIGWRDDARHLLVYASDDLLHIAGDGRFAGLPEPNDEKCHLNETGYYSHAELQDYPSIGQIRYQANENNINIIFAVKRTFSEVYKKVQSMIPGSSLGFLDSTSENIVKLISRHYEKLVKSLTIKSNSTSNFLSIKYFSRCLSKSGNLSETNHCDGIRVNNTVEFEVAVKALNCPERREDWNHTVEIKFEGISESMMVNVEMICDCKCAKKSDQTKTGALDEECRNRGVLECGVCSCNKGFSGKSCQCEGDQAFSDKKSLLDNCRVDEASPICSDHGSCMCGVCTCNKEAHSKKHYYGKFCQCDDSSCSYSSNGKLCGGNGQCKCGDCMCDSGWAGSACECRDDISLCRPPGIDGKICSDAGKCECGECKCDPKLGRNGRFCEDCPSCPSQRCDEFKDCVECLIHHSGKLYAKDPNCFQCSGDLYQTVDEVEEDPEKLGPGEHVCRIPGDDGSTFVFIYVYGDGEVNAEPKIIAKKDKEFRVIDDFLGATLGVVGLTLLLGFLILVIWKIVTFVHDKSEYDKFMKESSQADWGTGQNPLYKNATTVFPNPTFDSDHPGDDEL